MGVYFRNKPLCLLPSYDDSSSAKKEGFIERLVFRAVVIFWGPLIPYLPARAINPLSSDYSSNPERTLFIFNTTINYQLGSLSMRLIKGTRAKLTVNALSALCCVLGQQTLLSRPHHNVLFCFDIKTVNSQYNGHFRDHNLLSVTEKVPVKTGDIHSDSYSPGDSIQSVTTGSR